MISNQEEFVKQLNTIPVVREKIMGSLTHFFEGKGIIFSLHWKNPGNLNSKFKKQIKKLFIGSFLAQYLDDPSPSKQIENDLENYFIKSVESSFINNSKKYLLCASINKKLVGFIFWEDLGKNKVYISELAISHDYWRHGLGRTLIGSILVKKPLTEKIVLVTELENYGARNFYAAMGYKPSSYQRKGYSRKKFCSYEKLFPKQ